MFWTPIAADWPMHSTASPFIPYRRHTMSLCDTYLINYRTYAGDHAVRQVSARCPPINKHTFPHTLSRVNQADSRMLFWPAGRLDWIYIHDQHATVRAFFVQHARSCYFSRSDQTHLRSFHHYTWGDSDIILFHIYASWFLPPFCR